jgi:predicted dienelactone hydrolase
MTQRAFALVIWASFSAACDDVWTETAPGEDAGGPPALDAAAQADAAPPLDAAAQTSLDAGSDHADASSSDAQAQDAARARAQDASMSDALVPDTGASDGAPAADGGTPGAPLEYAVGTARIELAVRDGRVLPLQLWYPAVDAVRAEASAGHPVSEFEPPGPRRVLLEGLLASAPANCTNRKMHAAFDAPAHGAAAPYPLLVYSHHLEGLRVAQFSTAEALARLGFVVAAPDHSEMTLFDREDDLQSADVLAMLLRFRLDGLDVRAKDIEDVIGRLLAADASAVPESIRGKIDPARVGVFGHSMGSMTAGVVAARDTRVKAAAYQSAPPAAVLTLLNVFEQPAIESFRVPALFMLNQEDAPMNAAGNNDALREQFEAHGPLAYLVEVRDTGHWSFADDCALIPDFADGCGQGTRSVEPFDTFEHLSNAQAREIAARNLTAFFASQFLGRPPGALEEPGSTHAIVRSHPPRAGARSK